MTQRKNTTPLKPKHLTVCAASLGIAMASIGNIAFAATSYTLTDLSAVTTGGFKPIAIKANGTILGNSMTPVILNNANVLVPQIYDIASGSMTKIDSLTTGDTFASASAINASGQALGQVLFTTSTTGVSPNVFVRNLDGSIVDLGLFAGSKSTSLTQGASGIGISDTGKVVGVTSGASLCDWRTFVGNVNGGGLVSLGSLGGGTFDWTQAYGMNSTTGDIVGRSSNAGACLLTDTWHAFISTAAGLKDLQHPNMPVINPGNGGSAAYAVNDFGLVAGIYPYAFGAATRAFPAGLPLYHAVIWNTTAGTYTDLGKLNFTSALYSINASGQAVGSEAAIASTTGYATIGDVASGTLTNLNNLVTNLPAGWTLNSAFNISDAGQILVTATDAAAATHYALLSPATTPAVVAPIAPSGLTSTPVSTSQINLSWTDNANNETGQSLERCQGVGCTNFAPIATLAANVTSYSDTGLTAGTSYSYRTLAQGTAGNSAYSNTATAATLSVVTPTTTIAAPSGLTSTLVSRYKVGLSWVDNSNNESKFAIERCKGANCTSFSKIQEVSRNVTTYTDTSVKPGTLYSYRVRAYNYVGKSDYSNTLSVTTLP